MKLLRYPILCLAASSIPLLAHAQDDHSTAAGLAGCGALGALVLIPIIIGLLFLTLNIVMLVWVARDAKARGLDNSVLWMILVFFTSFVGLIIYLFSRPKGDLVPCANCGNKRLQVGVKCPTCGIGG